MKISCFALWLSIVAGCHWDSPGLLGEYQTGGSDSPDAGDSRPRSSDAGTPKGGSRAPRPEPDAAVSGEALRVVIVPTPDAVCPGECLMLRATAHGAEGNVEYEWTGDANVRGAGPHEVCPQADSIYTVLATDSGESVRATISVRLDYCGAADGGSVAPDPDPLASEWPMLGYDLGSTYYNRVERVLTPQNATSLSEKFTVDLGREVNGAPLLVGGRIFVNAGSEVRCYDLASGAEIWRHDLGADQITTNSMAHDAGKLYLQQENAKVVVLGADDGSLVWTAESGSDRSNDRGDASPIVAGGIVLIPSSSDAESPGQFRNHLTARRTRDAFLVWRADTADGLLANFGVQSTPSVDLARGLVYVTTRIDSMGSSDPAVLFVAHELMTGLRRFAANVFAEGGLEFGANPVLFSYPIEGQLADLLAAGDRSGKVYAMRRDTGEMVWIHSFGEGAVDGSRGIFANTTWSGKHVLVAYNEGLGANTSLLVALDPANGSVVWERRLSGLVLGRITVANGVGFVGAGTSLEVFDAENGKLIRSIATGGPTAAGVATIANGVVAFGTGARWLNGTAEGAKVFVFRVDP